MKYWNKIFVLSVLWFQLYLALKLKELSLVILTGKVKPQLQGVRQARIIQSEAINPASITELMKVYSVKKLRSNLSKKLDEIKFPLIEIKQNQPKIQMQKQLESDSNKTRVLLLKTRHQYMPMASTLLPREFFASVRENKKLLDQQKQRIQRITHRQKKYITHTVVLKVANKQKKFRQSNDYKSLSQKWRKNRIRRELQNTSISKAVQRIKKQQFSSDLVDNAQLIIQKGKLLLCLLDNLFKDANFYLTNDKQEYK